jgi:uncharacterized protein YjbI with pentapeptide repeats
MKQIRYWAGIIGFAIVSASGLVGSDQGLAETNLPMLEHGKLSVSTTRLTENIPKAVSQTHESYKVATTKTANPSHIKQLQETGQCPRCNLRGADLKGLDLYRINSDRPFYREDPNSGVVIRRANLSGADLSGADLSNATLIGADLRSTNLRGAKLYSVGLIGSDLRGADLSNADLRLANWTKVKLDRTTKIFPKWKLVWEIVNHGVQGRNLSGMDFKDVNMAYDYLWRERFEGRERSQLRGANFSNADLSGTLLRGMDLSNANLSGANLQGAILIGARLVRADLSYADLKGAVVTQTDISYANLKGARNFPSGVGVYGISDCGAVMPNGKVVESPFCP